jgi:hypothetical protein
MSRVAESGFLFVTGIERTLLARDFGGFKTGRAVDDDDVLSADDD